jgi:putative oxidoreductase
MNVSAVVVASYTTAINLVLLLVHVFLGLTIFTHGFRKVFRGGRLPGTAGWFESIGMKPGMLNAYAAAFTELGVGVFLTLGLLTPLACAGLLALMIVAIVSVHRKNGFMITNPGGGMEYCLTLSVFAVALGTWGPGRFSVDHGWDIFSHWTTSTRLLVTLIVGIGAACLQLAACYRPPKAAKAVDTPSSTSSDGDHAH